MKNELRKREKVIKSSKAIGVKGGKSSYRPKLKHKKEQIPEVLGDYYEEDYDEYFSV